jgi:hypothetical protein
VDIGFYSPHHLRGIYALFAANARIISALYAVIIGRNLRMTEGASVHASPAHVWDGM